MLVVPYKGCDDLYIFDLDGTLIDSNGLWMEVDVEFLARRGLAPTAEYEAVVARSIFPVAAAYTKEYYRLSDSPADIMAEWEALAAVHYRETVALKPGARALLEQCCGDLTISVEEDTP